MGGGGQGGGPWGGKDNKPRGPFGGGPKPPDIEEVLRKGQDRLKNLMPGGMGSARGIVLIGLAVLVVWLLTGFYRVETNQQAIELVFGRPRDVPTGEGLQYNLPGPIGRVIKVDVTNQRSVTIGVGAAPDGRATRGQRTLATTENLMLTGDENILDVGFVVFWQVAELGEVRVQHPQPGRDGEGGGRIGDAAGDRPVAAAVRPDRGPQPHRAGGPRGDPVDAQ